MIVRPSTYLWRVWNAVVGRRNVSLPTDLRVGRRVIDGEVRRAKVSIPHERRPEHIAVLGRTGSGKSSLLRYFCCQDISFSRGFIFFDLHGDATQMLLAHVAEEEQKRGKDLSDRLIVIDPADRERSVGLNVLSGGDAHSGYVQIAEIAQLLRDRWKLDTLGVRTEELLRNSLLVLRENELTLLELSLLLTSTAFRYRCIRRTRNPEARVYFESRFEPLSDAMKGIYREAVLNKLTAFTADPHFRHLLGQTRSTFDLLHAVDNGFWIIVNLDKGRLRRPGRNAWKSPSLQDQAHPLCQTLAPVAHALLRRVAEFGCTRWRDGEPIC
jgi:Helicase HerA, central domain